jgi:CRISPR type III-A-associated protein Csm2
VELVDSLAEQQAEQFRDRELNSNQLRRFFSDVKDLYRRSEEGRPFESEIMPMFKMVRSKASYAYHAGQGRQSKIPRAFFDFLDKGIASVKTEEDFRRFVQHFEAVVGFLYGKGKVGGN